MAKRGKKENNDHGWCCCGNRLFWGILLLVLGLWYLARDLGLISTRISLWAVFLVILGIWLLVKRNKT